MHKNITENQVRMLCKNGRTMIIKGFKKKSGEGTFDAYLFFDKSQNKIVFQFPEKKAYSKKK